MNKIFVFSIGYPFGKYEPFLQEEMEYFENITLVSTFIGDTDKNQTRWKAEKNTLIHSNNLFFRGNKIVMGISAIKSVFCKIFWRELISEDIKPINIRKILQLLSCISKANQIVKTIEQKKLIDKAADETLIFYSYWMNQLALAATILARKYDGVAVSRCHGYDLYPRQENNQYVTLQRYLTRELDYIFSISQDGKSTLCALFDDASINKKIKVSRLGTKDYGIGPQQKESDYFTIVSCSNLVPLKRVDLILKAIKQIEEINIRWIHFGDGVMYTSLNDQVKQIGKKSNHIIELRGFTDKEKIMDFYKNTYIDIFVNVSESEGIPVSIMEALSFGIPCIGTDVGGVHEIINSDNGWLVKPNIDVNELARLIVRISQLKRNEVEKYRNNARNFWEKEYSSEINYKSFIRELESL